MSCIRPATPGFLVTLAATVCLALASFSVPYLQSIYFLKASISVDGFSGDVTFGTLGYCLALSNGTTCSKPSIGYELDINSLVGNTLPVQIPQAVVKWLTYALFLHVVALVLAAGSAFFGLLAHVREMSMTCCSTCVSGFAAAVALVAFIFDLVLFFVAKSRISAVGTASIGSAIWLTLVAWILLFFSSFFFTMGRCCINSRGSSGDEWPRPNRREEEHRLDAVRAEAERKALQAKPEGGLPAFHETQPLTARIDGDAVYLEPYKDINSASAASSQSSRAGYAPAPEGSRAIDDYYSTSAYPPQRHPKRQNSATTATTSLYPSTTSAASPPPRQPSHAHYPSTSYHQPQPQVFGVASPPPINPYYNDPPYGHGQQASSYSAIPIHQQQPSANADYSQQYTDPYAGRHVQHQASYHSYQTSGPSYSPHMQADRQATYHSPITQQRSYTLGGDGYGSPPPAEHQHAHAGSAYQSPIIAPVNTNVPYASPTSMSPTGPRPQPTATTHFEDAPPSYDDGNEHWAH